MPHRSWVVGLLSLAACGTSPAPDAGTSGPVYSGIFVGSWFGKTVASASNATSYSDAEIDIAGSGQSRIRLGRFCSSSDPGPQAIVDSDSGFTVQAYSCPPSGGPCPQTVSVDSGSGVLSGPTLTLTVRGEVTQAASPSCSVNVLGFTLTFTATKADPRLAQLPPLSGASVELGDVFGFFRAHWDPPRGDSDLWPVYPEWQVARVGGAWERVDLGGFDGRSGYVGLDVEELEVVRFRARVTNGYAGGPFTPELSVTTGFRAPYSLTPSQKLRDVRLTWTDPPRPQAIGLEIERGQLEADGGVTFTHLADVTPPASELVDTLPGEGRDFVYRGRWFNDTVKGYAYVTFNSVRAPLLAPDGLVLAPDRTGVDLHWTNHSLLATEIILSRKTFLPFGEGDLTVRLPASSTTYRDTVPSPGAYLYSLQAISESSGVSPPVEASTTTPMDPALGLDSSVVVLPASSYTEPRRDSAGHWYFVADGALMKTGDPGWVEHAIGPAFRVPRPVLIDAADDPHLLWARPASSGTSSDVVHEWFDGSWHSETVATLQLADSVQYPVQWTLDGAKKPVVVIATTKDSSGLRLARWSGSSYVLDSPAAGVTPVDALHGLAVAVAPDGRILVAVSGTQGLQVLERTGSWASTALSSSIPSPELDLLAGSTSVDLVARLDGNGLGSDAFVLHRQGSVWSAPTSFPQLCCGVPALIAASTLTGGRPAALMTGNSAGDLLARGDDGWATTPLGLNSFLRAFGYDPAGKMYGMIFLDFDFQAGERVLEFHER